MTGWDGVSGKKKTVMQPVPETASQLCYSCIIAIFQICREFCTVGRFGFTQFPAEDFSFSLCPAGVLSGRGHILRYPGPRNPEPHHNS